MTEENAQEKEEGKQEAEKPPKEEVKEVPKSDSENGKPIKTNLVTKAVKSAEQLMEQNDRLELNIKKLEDLQAEEALSGRSFGGSKVDPVEDTPAEYARKVMEGKV